METQPFFNCNDTVPTTAEDLARICQGARAALAAKRESLHGLKADVARLEDEVESLERFVEDAASPRALSVAMGDGSIDRAHAVLEEARTNLRRRRLELEASRAQLAAAKNDQEAKAAVIAADRRLGDFLASQAEAEIRAGLEALAPAFAKLMTARVLGGGRAEPGSHPERIAVSPAGGAFKVWTGSAVQVAAPRDPEQALAVLKGE